ncbi:Mitochondrial translocator assembly and maintenance protein 41 [Geranomyces variabilis]|uniref:Phosphatidate cytidylyltransferase, mitochondrial n=1 Tax=Geranomyces variabilis TaxID=109894 RepID=A0AAD5XSE4_9FUNG|nr:Mitochondrial translocator assembly and maintenance protein 41 [Geranomyces variabilis]
MAVFPRVACRANACFRASVAVSFPSVRTSFRASQQSVVTTHRHLHATTQSRSPPSAAPTALAAGGAADVQSEMDLRLQSVVADFHAPVRFAIAYGSGVFLQKGYKPAAIGSKDAPMVDFLFGVTHPEHWHSLNIRQNRHHYSALAYLGSKVVSNVQETMGAGLYFNPDVEVAGVRIKYGVVSMDRLIRDLHDWETLYLAGRLQKPVKVLRSDARVNLANRRNLRASVRAALLLLPSEFTEEELFCAIAGLSYTGDFRMKMGENPHKVFNIVYTQMDAFRELYKPVIEDLPNVNYVSESQIVQDLDARLRAQLLQKLPQNLHDKIYLYYQRSPASNGSSTAALQEPQLSLSVASSPQLAQITEQSLGDIVRWPAISQSLKGILTAGFARAFVYAGRKLKKSFAGRSSPRKSS